MLASAARATGILVGWLADRALGDPQRFHPVAGFGTLALALERCLYRNTRPAGTLYAATLVGGAVALGVAVESVGRRRPLIRVLGTAVATWAVLGGRSLAREAEAIADALEAGDLPRAQGRVRNLVSRDPSVLDADGVARATVESVAENTSDAVVAPLLWGAVAGVPGLLGYRAANTLDAMVGYRNERYTRFGWAAARLDDALNWVPARLAGALAGLSALVTLPLALPFSATLHDMGLLAGLGLFQLAIPCVLAVFCAGVLKAPEVALLALLEVIFGILLAWFGAGEVPGSSVLTGGSLVIGALVVNELIGWRQRP